jgi:hypothetical protein
MADDPKKPSERDRELKDVIRQERARGKKHVDPEAEETERKFREGYLQVIGECDEQGLIDVLLALGIERGNPRFQRALAAWHDYQRQRASQRPRKP